MAMHPGGGLGRWLDRLISPLREEPHPPVRSAPKPPSKATVQASLDCEHTREKLRTIITQQPNFSAGCFHLIGLASLKEKLGPRWPSVESKVQQVVERLLAQHLKREDAWFRHGPETYVVVFASLNKLEAQLLCGRVVKELHNLLLGDSDAAAIMVETAVVEAGGEMSVESRSLDSLLSSALEEFHVAPGDAAAAQPCPNQARQGGLGGREEAAKTLGWVLEEDLREPVSFLYRPIWDAKHQVISTYLCRPARRRPSGMHLWGYDVLRDGTDTSAILDLDTETLSHSVSLLHELVRNKFRLMMTLPLHFETMAVLARRRQYLQLCRMIPKQLSDFLAFELNCLPAGVPASRLIEFVNALKPHCRAVLARTDVATGDMASFGAAGIKIVGAELPHHGDPMRHLGELARFTAAAHKMHLLTYLDEVNTDVASVAGQTASFDFMMGDFVGPWVEVPETAVRRTRDDLAQRARVKAPGRRVAGMAC
ncbi:MAG TPA: hypothetical protein VEB20_10795 [Azospirillaceae bacterium]|nr:hypothetical protein [Azospirillaceae bacterium]